VSDSGELPNAVRCPECGRRDSVIGKGIRNGVQRLCCNAHERRKYFQSTYRRSRNDLEVEVLARKFLLGKVKLEELAKETHLKKSTLNQRIISFAKRQPRVIELSRLASNNASWGRVLGVDTTIVKVKKREYHFIYAADVLSGDTLSCALLDNENTQTVGAFLREIREQLGYYPILAICDMDPTILEALQMVFPSVRIQGCLYHLMAGLDKELPTTNKTKKWKLLGKYRRQIWIDTKKIIRNAAYSANMELRNVWIDNLLELKVDVDEDVRKVIKNFRHRLHYYIPIDELKNLVGAKDIKRIAYNNICERHIQWVKADMGRRMKGWKSLDTVMPYINTFIGFKKRALELAGGSTQYTLPLFLFEGKVDLSELASAIVPLGVLVAAGRRYGSEIFGNYAFPRDILKEIKYMLEKQIQVKGYSTLEGVMQIAEVDMDIAIKIVDYLGFRTESHGLGPTEFFIR
jgi:transposase-like protein